MRSSSTIPKAAIAQLCSTSDKLSNLAAVAKCAGMAQKQGASMLFLPECFGFIGDNSKQTILASEPPIDIPTISHRKETEFWEERTHQLCDVMASIVSESCSSSLSGENDIFFQPYESYPLLSSLKLQTERQDEPQSEHDTLPLPYDEWRILPALQTIAKQSGLWISAGGMHERYLPPTNTNINTNINTPPKAKVYNTHILLNSNGDILTKYQKIHLFDVHIPSQNLSLHESATTLAGSTLVVYDTPLGRLGLSTCYDVRFPELYLALVRQGKAEILAVPAAFTVPTGKAHWQTLLKARAIETQCFVIAAAQCGRHTLTRESYGHSLGVGPWGDVMVDAGAGANINIDIDIDVGHPEKGGDIRPLAPRVVICDIDLKEMERIRERMPIQKHRDSSHFSF